MPAREGLTQRERPASATLVLLLLGALTTVGFLLRLPGLSTSLFADELGTYYVVAGHGATGIVHLLAMRTWDLNPPLFYVLAWVGRQAAGNDPQALRLISIAAGTACVPFTYILGRQTVGRRAGLMAAGLVSVGPFMVYFSSEARPFALATFLCLASTIALLRALRTRRAGWWAVYAVGICTALYTQYTSIFVLVAQFVWAFWTQREARWSLGLASAAGAIAFLPWLPTFASQGRSPLVRGIGILEPFGLHVVWHDLLTWSIGAPFVQLSNVPGQPALVLVALGAAVVLLGFGPRAGALRGGQPIQHPAAETMLLVSLAGAAPLGAAVYSSLAQNSIWEAKDLITSWPALALVAGLVIGSAPRPAMIVGGALLFVGLALGSARLLGVDHQRPDYDAAARYIRAIGGPKAPIAEVAGLTPGPMQAMEVAVRLTAAVDPNPVLRVGAPPLALVLRNRPGAVLPNLPGRAVAGRAAALANGGRFFMVTLGSMPVRALVAMRHLGPASQTDSSLYAFVSSIPTRFTLTAHVTFRGFIPVSVYTFSDRNTEARRALATN